MVTLNDAEEVEEEEQEEEFARTSFGSGDHFPSDSGNSASPPPGLAPDETLSQTASAEIASEMWHIEVLNNNRKSILGSFCCSFLYGLFIPTLL